MSRTIDEDHFTKTGDITVEIPENIKFFFAKTSKNYFEINIDKNEYHPISYEKYNTETKTNLIPKYKPKILNWQSPIVEKDDLIIEKNQKGPYTAHHDDDYLRLINSIKTQQKPDSEDAKILDIFYDEKTKITEILIRETQILDPVLHKVKMREKNHCIDLVDHTGLEKSAI